MEEAEAQAREKGRKYVMGILQRPEQLEKVTQYQRRVAQKKASVDALVKTALQGQLDSVRKGLDLLRSAQSQVEKVREDLQGFHLNFDALPLLDEIKEENRRHSQLTTAKENLKNIFSVPEYVTKTKDWIAEGKLLYAAKSLSELENSRDELMFELHKQGVGSKSDMVLLSMYFEEVEGLSIEMAKQVRLVLARTLNTVRKDPTIIVTALRVVELEEVRDAAALQRQRQSDFITPNRPKKWREMSMEVLKSAVQSRIEGTQTDERERDKMWLVKHLELTRQLLTEDLRVVGTLCAPCFPPSWQIVESYNEMYLSCLQSHMEDLISNELEGNEVVTLLSWVLNTYPELGLPVPLLSRQRIEFLQKKYLAHIEGNLASWMERALIKEREDWDKFVEPEQDGGVFLSPTPAIISQMVEQNMSVARTVSPEFTTQVGSLCSIQIARYADLYIKAVRAFRSKHFEDRSKNAVYTQHMIAVLNNCVSLHKAASAWSKDGRNNLLKVRNEAVHYLLQEPFFDLKPQFDGLFSQPWLQGPNSAVYTSTICETFNDYFGDYALLLPENLTAVVSVAQAKVVKAYIYKIIQGNITFTSYEERKNATSKIRSELQRIRELFERQSKEVPADPGFDLVEPLTEIIRGEDAEMVLLDLHKLVELFPEVTDSQLSSLLLTRGDLSRTDVREKVSLALKQNTDVKDTLLTKGMFSLRGKGMLNMDWEQYWINLINP